MPASGWAILFVGAGKRTERRKKQVRILIKTDRTIFGWLRGHNISPFVTEHLGEIFALIMDILQDRRRLYACWGRLPLLIFQVYNTMNFPII